MAIMSTLNGMNQKQTRILCVSEVDMGTKMTIVLDIENMDDFDVNFKDKIHGGTVIAMAKYDAINYTSVVEDVLGNSDCFECIDALDEIKEKTET